MVGRELALDLDLFSRGGLEILRAIERQDYDVLSARPAISKRTKLQLALRAVSGKVLPFLRLGSAIKREGGLTHAITLDDAYAACRAIAKREAKNFYYAFVALPDRSETQSAPSTPSCARPTILPTTRAFPATSAAGARGVARQLGGVCQGGDTADPVFVAVAMPRDASQFRSALLDELVAGTTMDLEPRPAMRQTPMPHLPISTDTATWLPQSSDWSASASLATTIRRREAGGGDRHRLSAHQHLARRR